jgi:hypothetical protein
MNKTNKIFNKYFSLISEQPENPQQPQEDVSGTVTPPTEVPTPPVEQEVPVKEMDENERYIIKILTNSFIFNPSLFDANKKKYIVNKIDTLSKSVNTPVPTVVNEIKKILALDNSLRVESKTLSLISKYTQLIEQARDATEPQAEQGEISSTKTPQTSTQVAAQNGAEYKLNLTEIFPLYKELILKSLRHIPTEEELMILKPIVNEFADVDPEKIVSTIQDLITQSSDDKLEGILSNA